MVGENLTKREIVQQAESKYGLRAIHVNRGRDDRDYAVSGHKFREATGWEPRKTVADALEEVHAQALYDRAIQGYAVA